MRRAAFSCLFSLLLIALSGCAGGYEPLELTIGSSGSSDSVETTAAVSTGNTILAEAFTYDE